MFLYLAFCLAATGVTITEKTAGMKKRNGFYPLYWDERAGNLFLEIERPGEEFLFYTSLAAGLGSNDVGLDRNQLQDNQSGAGLLAWPLPKLPCWEQAWAVAQIERFERDPKVIPVPRPLEPPPGQPIGCLME